MNGWDLFFDGRIAEAVSVLAAKARRMPRDPVAHFEYANALAHTGAVEAAIVQIRKSIEIDGDDFSSSSAYELAGILEFISGRPDKALADWKRGLKARYTDAAGGMWCPLLLWFGAVRSPQLYSFDEAEAYIRKCLRAGTPNWPAGLGSFIYGEANEEELNWMIEFPDQSVQSQQQLEADFFIALSLFHQTKKMRAYRDAMRRLTQDPHSHRVNVALIAKWELNQVKTHPTT